MTQAPPKPDQSVHPLQPFIERLLQGDALLPDNPTNLIEVVGILKSYGVVLDAYARNLKYVATDQFLLLFPFFKYFNGEVTTGKLLRHWWHDRINYEYAEYCMKGMLWHGGGGLDDYLDSDGFKAVCGQAIAGEVWPQPDHAGAAPPIPGIFAGAGASVGLLLGPGAVLDGDERYLSHPVRSL
jgi:hypothetical protein